MGRFSVTPLFFLSVISLTICSSVHLCSVCSVPGAASFIFMMRAHLPELPWDIFSTALRFISAISFSFILPKPERGSAGVFR